MDWEDCSQISAFDRVCGLDRATHAMKKIYYSMYIIYILYIYGFPIFLGAMAGVVGQANLWWFFPMFLDFVGH